LSSARNLGLDLAQGLYVGFVDSDDWIADDMYSELLHLIKLDNSDVAACGMQRTNCFACDVAKNAEVSSYEGKAILRNYLLEGARSEPGAYSVGRYLYRRALFTEIRFPLGKLCEDIATNYRVLARARRMAICQKKLYFYFQRDSSLSRGGLRPQHFDLFDACRELALLTVDETDHDIKYLIRVLKARCYFSILTRIALYGFADSTIDRKRLIRELTRELRKNYFMLMLAPIPLSRKMMTTLLCICFESLEFPLKIYKLFKVRGS
jgi:glycosyltransferase involved in cell wall biosynthesis